MSKGKKNTAFMKPVHLSEKLEAVVGKGPMPRTEVTKKLWDYIKKNSLQDATNKRNINPDAKLAEVFGGNQTIDMFKMTSLVSKHLSDEPQAAAR
jgi:chromatin remodeling complex protein RSC6